MLRTILLSLLVPISCILIQAQVVEPSDLASRLANRALRQSAIEIIRASPGECEALMLSWINDPPANINALELKKGMSAGFGILKTSQAIPFLIENINLEFTPTVNTWIKEAAVIRERMPALNALVRIGQPAIQDLIRSLMGCQDQISRRAMLFTLAQIGGPRVVIFLRQELAELNQQRYWVLEGLRGSGVPR